MKDLRIEEMSVERLRAELTSTLEANRIAVSALTTLQTDYVRVRDERFLLAQRIKNAEMALRGNGNG